MFDRLFRHLSNGPITSRENVHGGRDYYDRSGPIASSRAEGEDRRTYYDRSGPVAREQERTEGTWDIFRA
jgi:hypothetical protein